jgi:TrmH family RNA methyltransferase
MPDITSPHNPRLKAAIKLRDRRARESTGRFLIDGLREIERAAQSGIIIEEAFVKEDAESPGAAALASHLQESGATVLTTASVPFEKLAFGNRDEGVVAVAQTPRLSLGALKLPPNPLIAVLEGIEKPGNIGAVLRTADAAGVSAVILADCVTDLYNPNAIRASLGAIFTVRACAASAQETLAWLKQHGLAIFAARVDGAADYASASYRGPSAIVLGSEAQGLSEGWNGPDVMPIALPMQGIVDSLNVSATAAVLFYEAARQRQQTAPSP